MIALFSALFLLAAAWLGYDAGRDIRAARRDERTDRDSYYD